MERGIVPPDRRRKASTSRFMGVGQPMNERAPIRRGRCDDFPPPPATFKLAQEFFCWEGKDSPIINWGSLLWSNNIRQLHVLEEIDTAVRSSWLSFWRPLMKKSMGKTDLPYAVKRRGRDWGLCIMESWLRKFLSSAAMVRLYFPALNLLLKLTSY